MSIITNLLDDKSPLASTSELLRKGKRVRLVMPSDELLELYRDSFRMGWDDYAMDRLLREGVEGVIEHVETGGGRTAEFAARDPGDVDTAVRVRHDTSMFDEDEDDSSLFEDYWWPTWCLVPWEAA